VKRTFYPLQIPSRTHVLANGMRVVAHEERSSPIVAVHLMYHVGSKDETPGRTGLAHLLEHLMFEGSEHCPKGEFDTLLEAVGGSNNGSTWLDRTNYYETVPSHAVELALWLERDRMAHFLPVLDDEMLETQRSVVINERRQSYENRPYGRADERLQELLFGVGHPYAWPTIGYMADLEGIKLSDVRRFYQDYYTPANAVLVLAGDVAADDAFALAEHYFSDLPAGAPTPSPTAPPTESPAGSPREVMQDRVSFPRVYRAAAVPAYGTADWVALDVLAYLLADGESSRLQRVLVRDRQLAQDVDTYLYPTELQGIFGMVATARSGVDAAVVEEALAEVIEDVARNGVPADEVAGAIRRVRRDQVASLALVEERAEALAFAATVLGAADQLELLMDSYSSVTLDDVARVAHEFLDPERAAVVTVVPSEAANDR
jgi:zinc protease